MSEASRTIRPKYKAVPPEGGWGNVVTLALAVMFIVTTCQMSCFGIVYGNYLSQLGDESSSTTTLNCIYNSMISFMGLIANSLLQNYSRRFVGVVGSLLFFMGSFLTVFATSVAQLVFTYGMVQGAGCGIMICTGFASFNDYFVIKNKFMMGVSQTIVGAIGMVIPLLARYLMDTYGYRGTVAIFAALSLHSCAAMLTLQPVEQHMKRILLTDNELSDLQLEEKSEYHEIKLNRADMNGSDANPTERTSFISTKLNEGNSVLKTEEKSLSQVKLNMSNDKTNWEKFWGQIVKFLELSLLKDPKYVNIALGISVSFLSDIMFLSLLPMFLAHMNFSDVDVAHLVTVYMISDLVGRILLSLFTAFVQVKSRSMYIVGVTVTAVFRIVFTLESSWLWMVSLCILLGSLRCLIQVLAPVVLAEYAQHNFSAAYGLSTTISGIFSLIYGSLSGAIVVLTDSDTWAMHMLTVLLLFCSVSWICELAYTRVSNLCKSPKENAEYLN